MTKSTKKSAKNSDTAQNGGILTVGLDIGYGVVKAITDEHAITFHSVAGHAREFKFQQEQIENWYAGDQITGDDGTWFVGNLVTEKLRPGELLRLCGCTSNEERMGNSFRVRLAKVAIAKSVRGMTVDALYLAGGGAELVYETVRHAYPQAQIARDA